MPKPFLPTLSPEEATVLSSLAAIGHAPVRSLAESSGLKPHVVRALLRRLTERGALRPFCALNCGALGLSPYTAYFSLDGTSAQAKRRVTEALTAHPSVSWLAELAAEPQYGVQLLAPSAHDALRAFGELRAAIGLPWAKKAILQFSELHFWPLKPFLTHAAGAAAHSIRRFDEPISIDDLDHALLRFRSFEPLSSDARLARAVGLPDATATYRLRRMQAAGVITGYGFMVNPSALGVAEVKVLVALRVADLSLTEQLLAFAKDSSGCIGAGACLGAWDFEFTVLDNRHDSLRRFTSALSAQFGGVIDTLQVLQVEATIKASSYPFANRAPAAPARIRAAGRALGAA